MVDGVEVVVVGHVMHDDLSVDYIALALLTDFIQSLIDKENVVQLVFILNAV